MKTIFSLTISFGLIWAAWANTITQTTFKVSGNCEMCEKRIETAATVKGVKSVSWNAKTQQITIQYDAEKVNPENIQQKIAAVGHDTEAFKAPDNIYQHLPHCCQYRH